MALIDTSELMTDPDFVDKMKIIHRKPTVNEMGENMLSEFPVDTVGSIQPITGRALQRLPEALRVVNISSFWVKGKIISDGCNQYPDILVFGGSRYSVQTVLDWTNWGEGWCEGTAVREKPTA